MPGVKTPTPSVMSAGSGPTTALMKSAWLIAGNSAWRIRLSLKGGCRWLGRRMPIKGRGSIGSTRSRRLRPRSWLISGGGCSIQSISPDWIAAEAVEGSAIMCHSTRSKCASFGPAVRLGRPFGVGL